MSKFNLGDKVYYLERDWYLEEAVKHCGNEYTRNGFDKSLPFEVLAVKHVKTKDVWNGKISESFVYDLAYIENQEVDMRENIEEDDIFLSFEECCTQAILITENTRWQ